METLQQCMLRTLEELGNEEFKKFQWFLQQPFNVDGLKPLPKYRLENADRTDTIDLIVQNYPRNGSQIMAILLKQIERNDLVERFPNGPKDVSDVPDTSSALQLPLRDQTMVVEELRNPAGQQQSPPWAGPAYADPTDVACDLCTGTRQHKALMSCLACKVSYCETHLQPHYNVPAFKKHKLVRATARLQEKLCPIHDKLMKIYCRTDQQCICNLCAKDGHEGHDTVPAAEEKSEKQKQLAMSQKKVQQKIQERKEELKDLRQFMKTLKSYAEAAIESSDKVFSEMIVSLERKHGEVKELIRDQEKAAVARTEELLSQLEEEMADLERRHAGLEELSNTDDIINLIQRFQSLSSSSGPPALPSLVVHPVNSFTEVSDAVSGLRDKMEDLLKATWPEISKRGSTDIMAAVHHVLPPDPQTRDEFLQYACPLSLDSNTINNGLLLSEENRKVTFTQLQGYPDHPERFTSQHQVLCRESLSERSYWEVEWKGSHFRIAVSYKDISRKELTQSVFGDNDKSWSLKFSPKGYGAIHNKVETKVPTLSGPQSSKLGVYLDQKAGTLSFYSVSNKMTLLHTVQTTFRQPLYTGIRLYRCGDTAHLCKIW